MKKGKKSNVMNKLTKVVKNKFKPSETGKQTVEQVTKKMPLKSNTEVGSLEEFVQLTQLSQKKFETLNEQVVIQNINYDSKNYLNNQYSNIIMGNILKGSDIHIKQAMPLPIPRRPIFKGKVDVKEFERQERESFLNWRRALALEEEKNMTFAITPFEKNIDIWRQLWMVVEKADLLVQIVDGRNPLYFRCEDLDAYVKEISPKKDTILLINKSDLLSLPIRKHWADYFKEKGIGYVFFSAKKENEKIEEKDKYDMLGIKTDELLEDEEDDVEGQDNDDEDDGEDNETAAATNQFSLLNELEKHNSNTDEVEEHFEKSLKISMSSSVTDQTSFHVKDSLKTEEEGTPVVEKQESLAENSSHNNIDNGVVNINAEVVKENTLEEGNHQETPANLKHENQEEREEDDLKVLTREELIRFLKKKVSSTETKPSYNIGFVGFPNVGKSSVINVIMNEKKVGVASMPGKTKHYQTLFLNHDRTFCLIDCPGLVFPSFTKSKADMICNGILNIDTIVDYHSPIAIVVQNIPRQNLMHYFKISLPEVFSASQFLKTVALKRGFFTGSNTPDEARIAKIILKEYVNGHLLFNNLRPDYDVEKHGPVVNYEVFDDEVVNQTEYKLNQDLLKQVPADFDDNFDKLGGEFETKEKIDEFDLKFFQEESVVNKSAKISKDMRRMLKFAVKRGEITQEEADALDTVEDMENLLKAVEKDNKAKNTLNKDLVNKRSVNM